MAVSSGDPAPLVGHNAFLRWSAIREVSWVDSKDGERKFWSERHVSEDFDLALRLQVITYFTKKCPVGQFVSADWLTMLADRLAG